MNFEEGGILTLWCFDMKLSNVLITDCATDGFSKAQCNRRLLKSSCSPQKLVKSKTWQCHSSVSLRKNWWSNQIDGRGTERNRLAQ